MTVKSIEKLEKYLKNALIGIIALLLYFFLPSFEGILFELFNINTETLPLSIKLFYSTAYDMFMISIMILLFYKNIKKDIADIKKNHKKYYSKYFNVYLIGLAVMMISNTIITLISNGGNSGNQEAINEMFEVAPAYMYFSAVIFAPIVEELTFRQAIKYIIPNKILFIIVSGLLFGGLHVIGTTEVWTDLLYLVPYSALGVAFAYILQKTNNILVTIGLHFMHNGILMALQLLMLLLG